MHNLTNILVFESWLRSVNTGVSGNVESKSSAFGLALRLFVIIINDLFSCCQRVVLLD